MLGQQLKRARRDRGKSHLQNIFLKTSPKNRQAKGRVMVRSWIVGSLYRLRRVG
ncbi:hypothetical protein DPMN_088187 [Dreissena polymorpha]|uniref:Uncharacterized protein n=1 Tax=Dreissena polymorpha TaxID=45954 RepID=A0A9D4QX31_DREPO|nr:hypothetical protein DPMN_088187 [Dreissena polymorpha]